MQPSSFSESPHFTLQPLADDIYAAIAEDGGAAISNAGLIDLGGNVAVFDTFLTPQAAMHLRRMAEAIAGRAPQWVFNSHYHNDHVWGNQVFVPEAQILSTTRTRELIATAGMEEFEWYSANSAQRLSALRSEYESADEHKRRQIALWIGYYAGLVEALPGLSVCLPGVTFDDRLELHGSKYDAELISFEGAHTESDTVLYLPQAGVVFMSDLLFVGCHPYLADGDPQQLLKALRELSQVDATTFVPGHGPVGALNDLHLLIEYIEACFETASRLAGAGEDQLARLEIPARYQDWQLSQFYQANIRFLCEKEGYSR